MASDWAGLTEDEENALWESTVSDWELMKRTEEFLREKNAGKPVGINCLTHEEESATASVMGIVGKPTAEDKAGGEPVAWMREGWGPDCGPYVEFYRDDEMGWRDRKEWTPLYTRPQPQAEAARVPEASNQESAYQRGYLDGMAKPCTDCADYKAMYLKVRDELAAEQQKPAPEAKLREKNARKDMPAANQCKPMGLEESVTDVRVCCGEYAKCHRACTPRGRWQATQETAEDKAGGDEWELRGRLATLKCWHRLSEDEVNDLIAFFSDKAGGGEPLFWYRPCSNGMYEGPIHNAQIEQVRKESGAWFPLFTRPQPQGGK